MLHLIIRILPVRREILLGTLYSDLIGFHTYDYARHFLSSCTRILALPTMPNGVEFAGRLAHVGTFPIGIDPSSFTEVSFAICSTMCLTYLWKLYGTEFEEGQCAEAHQTIREPLRRREGDRRCRPLGLYQGCTAEAARSRALLKSTSGMDRQGTLLMS